MARRATEHRGVPFIFATYGFGLLTLAEACNRIDQPAAPQPLL